MGKRDANHLRLPLPQRPVLDARRALERQGLRAPARTGGNPQPLPCTRSEPNRDDCRHTEPRTPRQLATASPLPHGKLNRGIALATARGRMGHPPGCGRLGRVASRPVPHQLQVPLRPHAWDGMSPHRADAGIVPRGHHAGRRPTRGPRKACHLRKLPSRGTRRP